MAKLIHSMIRVLDEKRSVDFYGAAFGLEIAQRVPFDGFTLIYLRNAETSFELELTVNAGHEKPYDLGDGYGHIAVSVSDLEAEHARVTAAGFSPGPMRVLEQAGRPFAHFFFMQDPDGYKIEVLQRAGRFE